jgi:hypothetical protein
MNKYQTFALGHFLSDYPDDASFDQIIELVEQEDEAIMHWEPYESFWGEHLATMITGMARALKEQFNEKH